MLYFSRVEIDPDKIDADQIEKLRSFKEKTYPKGLVEHYKKTIDFREKFSRQLELKIRELQQNDAGGTIPLSLQFLSIEKGELASTELHYSFDHLNVSDFEGNYPVDVPSARYRIASELRGTHDRQEA